LTVKPLFFMSAVVIFCIAATASRKALFVLASAALAN